MKTKLISRFGRCADGWRVTECRNLRPAATHKGLALEPAPEPTLAFSDNWIPFAEVPLADGGTTIVCRRDDTLAVMSAGRPVATATCTLSGNISAIAPDCNRLQVIGSDSEAPQFYAVTASSITLENSGNLDAPHIVTSDYIGVQADFEAVTLSKTYAASTAFANADKQRLSQKFIEFYELLDRNAQAVGAWWQPVLMRTVLRDAEGRILHTSPIVLVTHPDGEQFRGVIDLQSSDNRTTDPLTVKVPAWNIGIHIPESCRESYARAATLQVEATPQLHATDVDNPCFVHNRNRVGENYFCKIWSEASPTGIWPGSVYSRVLIPPQLAAQFQSLAKVVHTVTDPAEYAGTTINIPNPSTYSVKAGNALLKAAFGREVEPADRRNILLRPPHSFNARNAACAAGTVVYSGITALPFRGYRAEDFATVFSSDSAPWHAYVETRFADNSTTVATSQGVGGAPIRFGPMLSYPAPGAVRITIVVKTAGQTRSGSYRLCPDPSGAMSIGLLPGMKPEPLPDEIEAFVVPPAKPLPRPMPGCIVAAAASSPTVPAAISTFSGVSVNALVPAISGGSSWEFGRSRFYAMTSAGIHLLGVGKDRKSLSLNLVDSRIVEGRHAVAVAGRSVYAIASGNLVTLSGSSCYDFAPTTAAALAWDATRRELWCIPPDKSDVTVICPDFDNASYHLAMPLDATRTVPLPTATYVVADSRAYQLGSDAIFRSRPILWQAEEELRPSATHTMRFYADLVGAVDSLRIAFSRMFLNRIAPGPDLIFDAKGEIRSPLRRTFKRLPYHSSVRYEISGGARPKFIFNSIAIKDI